MNVFERAWVRCFSDLGGHQPPEGVLNELKERYSEPQRAYHTLQHLEECFTWFEQVQDAVPHPGDVAFALFYHDAIYDPRAKDNEAQSAALAKDVLIRHVGVHTERVVALIMDTLHSAVPKGADAQTLVDIDLSILGASQQRFDEYERQVRIEYGWVAPDAFRDGRTRVLQQFLDRAAIYSTSFFHTKLEAQARNNLRRSISQLA